MAKDTIDGFTNVFGRIKEFDKFEIFIFRKYPQGYNGTNQLLNSDEEIITYLKALKNLHKKLKFETGNYFLSSCKQIKSKEELDDFLKNAPRNNLDDLKKYFIKFGLENYCHNYSNLNSLIYYLDTINYIEGEGFKITIYPRNEFEGRYLFTVIRYLYESNYRDYINKFLNLPKELKNENFYNKMNFAHYLVGRIGNGHTLSQYCRYFTKQDFIELTDKYRYLDSSHFYSEYLDKFKKEFDKLNTVGKYYALKTNFKHLRNKEQKKLNKQLEIKLVDELK